MEDSCLIQDSTTEHDCSMWKKNHYKVYGLHDELTPFIPKCMIVYNGRMFYTGTVTPNN